MFPLKKDIDKNKEKKEITIIVIGNQTKTLDLEQKVLESTINKANNWCFREKLKHFELNVMDRSSLHEAFIYLSSRLNPPQNKSTFSQLSMGRKNVKTDIM